MFSKSFQISSKRFQNVSKQLSSMFDKFSNSCRNIFKQIANCFQNIFKHFCKTFQAVFNQFPNSFQEFFLTRFSKRFQTVFRHVKRRCSFVGCGASSRTGRCSVRSVFRAWLRRRLRGGTRVGRNPIVSV